MKKIILGIMIGIVVTVPAALVLSSAETNEQVESVFGKIEQLQSYFLKEKFKDKLQLSDAQMDKMMLILKASNAKRAEIIAGRIALVEKIEDNTLQADELSAALDALENLERQFFEVEQARRHELRQVLSNEQRAKFVVMRREMARKVFSFLKPFL